MLKEIILQYTTVEELAEAVGEQKRTVYNWINRSPEKLKIEHYQKIAEALGLPFGKLLSKLGLL